MARNRMIKPEFWSSVTLAKVSRDSRLLFIGLWTFADDYGFGHANTRALLGFIYPIDMSVTDDNIKTWIKELEGVNLITIKSVDDKETYYINSWSEHQKVDRPSLRRWITEEQANQYFAGIYINPSLDTRECAARHSSIKEKEKGKEKEKEKVFTKPSVQDVSDYCSERKNGIAAQSFLDHYESNGWMVGKTKMKDWKAAVRTWEKNNFRQSDGAAKMSRGYP
jgi:hypothetical protein